MRVYEICSALYIARKWCSHHFTPRLSCVSADAEAYLGIFFCLKSKIIDLLKNDAVMLRAVEVEGGEMCF